MLWIEVQISATCMISCTPLTLFSESGVEIAADAFVDAHKGAFGLDAKQLGTPRIATNNRIWFVRYPQVYDNHRVRAADLVLTVLNNGMLVGVAAALFPEVQVNTTPSLSSSAALQVVPRAAAVASAQGRVKTDLVIVPVELENAYAFGLAWEVVVYDDGPKSPLSKTYLIDAHSGKILEEYENIGGVTHVPDERRAEAPIAAPIVAAAPLPLFQRDVAVRKQAGAGTMPATLCSDSGSGSRISGQVSLNYHEMPSNKDNTLIKHISEAFPKAKYSITEAGSSSPFCTGYADDGGNYAATVQGPGTYTVTFTMANDVAFVESTVLSSCDTTQSCTLSVNGPARLDYDWGWGRLGEYGHTAVALNGLYHAREMHKYYAGLSYRGLDDDQIKILDGDYAWVDSGFPLTIETGGKYGRSSEVILHEYGHVVQYDIHPSDDDGKADLGAIREGVADFFAADKTNHSLFGGPAASSNHSDGPVPWRELSQTCPWLPSKQTRDWNRICGACILSTTIKHIYKQGMALAGAAWKLRGTLGDDVNAALMYALQMSLANTEIIDFRAAFTDKAGTEHPTLMESVFTDRRIGGPNMPRSLAVTCSTTGSTGRPQLTWADNSSQETGYLVERSPNNKDWSQIAALPAIAAGNGSYTDMRGTCTGNYYRVAAYKDYTDPAGTLKTSSVVVKYASDGGGGNAAQSMVSLSDQVIGLQTDSVATHTEASLHGAYPNPFNPITTVRFSLAEAGPVRLRVYDVLGRRVAVLADSDMVAGAHSVKFEAAHLPSGMYLLRMETARQHWTHWVSLVK